MAIDVMPSQLSREVGPALCDVIDEENKMLDARHAAFLRANLFRKTFIDSSSKDEIDQAQRYLELRQADCQTIADNFALFVHEDFIDKLNSLDLGKTKHPNDFSELEKLRNEYCDLGYALKDQGIIDGELPRDKSGLTLHFRRPANHNPDFVIGERNRPLIKVDLLTANDTSTITIAKRMTFAMRIEDCLEIFNATGSTKENDPRLLEVVEPLLDKDFNKIMITPIPKIYPVRTVYYGTAKPAVEEA